MNNETRCPEGYYVIGDGACQSYDVCDPTNIKNGGECRDSQQIQPQYLPKELPKTGAGFEINWWLIFMIFVIGFIIIGMYNNNRKR